MRLHSRARLAWSLLSLGQTLYVARRLLHVHYPDLLGGTVGFPSGGDAIYLSVYPALFAGLMLLVRRRDPQRLDRAGVLDSLILTVGFGLLSWIFLVAPNLHMSGLSAPREGRLDRLSDRRRAPARSAHPLRSAGGAEDALVPPPLRGTLALLATDCAYNYALLHGTYHHQVIYDAGWLAYIVLWGAAALHPSMRRLEEPSQESRTRLTTGRLALLAVACLVAPGIHFVEESGNADLRVVIGASGILFLLVVAPRRRPRTPGGARGIARTDAAPRRRRARPGRRPRERPRPGCRVRHEVVGDAKVRIVLWDDDGARVVASNGAGTWPVPGEAVRWLRARGRRTNPVSRRCGRPPPSQPRSASAGAARPRSCGSPCATSNRARS